MLRKFWLATGAIFVAVAAVGSLVAAVARRSADSRAMILPVDPAAADRGDSSGERTFTIEVADDPASASAG